MGRFAISSGCAGIFFMPPPDKKIRRRPKLERAPVFSGAGGGFKDPRWDILRGAEGQAGLAPGGSGWRRVSRRSPLTLRLIEAIRIATIKPGSGLRGWLRTPQGRFSERMINMAHIETKVLTAHVPLPLAEKVDQVAARLDRSRGWIIKQALSAWLEQEDERERLTREALADVDAGRVIDHQAVLAWADSLGTETPLPVPRR